MMFGPSRTQVFEPVVSLPSNRSAKRRRWRPGREGVGRNPANIAWCEAYVNVPGASRYFERGFVKVSPRMETSVAGLYAIGDMVGPPLLAHKAMAEGVVAAVRDVGLRVPLVVRLEGTNVELGKEIIATSNLNVTSADDLDDAAQKIVKAVKGT